MSGQLITEGAKIVIAGDAPTLYLRHATLRSAYLHCNGNIFYILGGAANQDSWNIVANGRWPLEVNLNNNNATFGGDVNATSFTTSSYVYGGNYVQGGSFYLASGRQVIYSNSGTSGQGSFEHMSCLHNFLTYIYGVRVIGNFSVDAGYTKNWRIKHPILKDKDLIHTCIEGTRADNLYRGRKQLINGECVVNIDLECNTTGGMTDGTFVLINKNIQVFVNNNETFDRVIGKVVGNKLNIKCENVNADCMIDWLVIGERCDDGIISNPSTDKTGSIIVEIDRPNDEVPPQPNYKV
jgi:hypothetical protein